MDAIWAYWLKWAAFTALADHLMSAGGGWLLIIITGSEQGYPAGIQIGWDPAFQYYSEYTWYMRPWSVDSLDGGATDVPILGPMEEKNDTAVLFYFWPNDCMKRAREKSTIQGINRPWPEYSYFSIWLSKCARVYGFKHQFRLTAVTVTLSHIEQCELLVW